MNTTLRLGTRGSELALAQSGHVAQALREAWPGLQVERVIIRTRGDADQERALASFGGKGVFTKELEEALLDGRIDLAVHSLKDLPGVLPDGLALAPTPRREDPRDCLIGPRLEDLPVGARIGTGSPRRRAQLLTLRPDLVCLENRGNLPTRVRKMKAGQFEAIVLAHAGLNRLGLEAIGLVEEEVHPLSLEECLPAAGQGLLGLECREGDQETLRLLGALAHQESAWAASAERAFLEELQGGCQAPAAGHARLVEGRLEVEALVADPEGTRILRARVEGSPEEAADLGRRAARQLLEAGADQLLGRSASPRPLEGKRVVVTRAADQAGALAERLAELGALPLLVPTIQIEPPEDPAPLDQALSRLEGYDWLIFTSPNAPARFMDRLEACGVESSVLAGLRIAAIGPSTAKAMEAVGLRAELVPEEYLAEGLLEAFEGQPMEGRKVLLARAAEARDVLPRTLAGRGAQVEVVPVYRTVPLETLPQDLREELGRGVDLVTVTASSVARAFHRLTADFLPPETTPLLAIGPITAGTARELGYAQVAVARESTVDGLVREAVHLFQAGSNL